MGGKGWQGDVSRSILMEFRKCHTSDGGRGDNMIRTIPDRRGRGAKNGHFRRTSFMDAPLANLPAHEIFLANLWNVYSNLPVYEFFSGLEEIPSDPGGDKDKWLVSNLIDLQLWFDGLRPVTPGCIFSCRGRFRSNIEIDFKSLSGLLAVL